MVKGMHVFDFEHDSVCQCCALEKNVKRSYSISHNISKMILDLLHTDFCGPMSSPSLISGYLYYLVFIDDFSTKSWI